MSVLKEHPPASCLAGNSVPRNAGGWQGRGEEAQDMAGPDSIPEGPGG